LNLWAIHHDSDRLRGITLLLLTAILWSTSGFFIKWIDWHPLAIVSIRSIPAAILIRFAFRRSALTWGVPELIGTVAYVVTVVTFTIATKLTTAANAILLQYTSPAYVAILSAMFLKEKPHINDWLTLGVVGCGMVMFFQEQVSGGSLAGNFLAIASGVSMAIVTVSLRWQKDGSGFSIVFWGNLLTFLCGLPFVLEGSPGLGNWAATLGMGVFQLGLAYVFYTTAIRYVAAFEASIVTMIEPILNPLWVFLLLGEVPGFWALAGGAVILVAIIAGYVLPVLFRASASNLTHGNNGEEEM
jgi:Predicted permease, DMT superfamily